MIKAKKGKKKKKNLKLDSFRMHVSGFCLSFLLKIKTKKKLKHMHFGERL